MQSYEDSSGLDYTASAPQSVADMEDIVQSFMAYRRDLGDRLKMLLKSDSDMRKAEVELLAKKYLARKENSKTRQLEAIETRFREFRYDRKANERAGAVSPW